MGHALRKVDIAEVWVDEGRLFVRAADPTLDLTHIYRASTSTHWDDEARAVWIARSDGLYASGFTRIVNDARSEYGVDFVLSDSTTWRNLSDDSRASIRRAWEQLPPHERQSLDDATMAGYVGDHRLWAEARELFKKKDWAGVVRCFESVQYPQCLEPGDLKRLEIARKRTQPETGSKAECDLPCPKCGEAIRVTNPFPERPLEDVRVVRSLFNAADANTHTKCQHCGKSVNIGWYFGP